jgi:hypothetical protein
MEALHYCPVCGTRTAFAAAIQCVICPACGTSSERVAIRDERAAPNEPFDCLYCGPSTRGRRSGGLRRFKRFSLAAALLTALTIVSFSSAESYFGIAIGVLAGGLAIMSVALGALIGGLSRKHVVCLQCGRPSGPMS